MENKIKDNEKAILYLLIQQLGYIDKLIELKPNKELMKHINEIKNINNIIKYELTEGNNNGK